MQPYPLDIAGLHARFREGVRPADVLDMIHARMAALDDPGIFIHMVPSGDAKAKAAQFPPFDPVRYPLWGVPFAVKDNIDVAGLPTTAACPDFAYVPEADASVVAKLIEAGAILIGKTNLDQFATGLVGVRTPHPVPRNAFDALIVPGGSSSGSAIAVAQGLASFALGTDTAGSGRVPAGLNNLVGLKPSLGALSTRGVVPACRTLDCVSVFATCVADAQAVFDLAAGFDAADPYSRPLVAGQPAPVRVLGVPRAMDRLFFGDALMEAAFDAALARLQSLEITVEEIDMSDFFAVARLLYEGPWVAERRAAIRHFMDANPDALHPVTRAITAKADAISATDTFEAMYRLAALKRATETVWQRVDALMVPTAPIAPTLAELAADPIGPNARLGTYTNFVNLLDLAALAVPGPFRADGFPAGVTFIAPRGSDHRLADFGARFFPGKGGALLPGIPFPRSDEAA
jgi:allophanate hydrolase